MATLTYPCRTPIIIKKGKTEQFLAECKKSGMTKERKQMFTEYFKSKNGNNKK